MRKLLTFVAGMFITGSLLAGGLVTNTNQSAAWVRLPSRNASVGIDAVYYNPAGLMKLENGFHVSISNQSIFQNRKITNDYAGPGGAYGLNVHTYEGTVTALAFPTVYAVYKMDKLAFSLGFNPIGGGGGAEYKTGLPSFEMSPSDLVPSLAAKAGVKGYRLDAYFKGSSTFLGFQGGVSYKINDWLSVAAGVRYVTAKNTYEGYLNDIQLDMGSSTWLPASSVLTGVAGNLTSIIGIPAKLAGAAVNYGTLTLAQLVGAGAMLAADKASIEAGLAAIGVPAAALPTMNINTIRATVTGATPALTDQVASITASSTLVANQSADVAQTGSGITPIISVNISPSENLNIAIKYEMMTKLELTNETVQDLTVGYENKNGSVLVPQSKIPDMTKPITMFPNGAKTKNDMPAMLSIGVDYKVSSSLKVSIGSNYFFDKTADYGHKVDADLNSATPSTFISNSDIIDNNGMSLQAGLEYNISEKLLVSGGYVWANKGVNSKYQSDLAYGLATQSFGFGGAYKITDNLQVNLGYGYTKYQSDEKYVDHVFSPSLYKPLETYSKSTKMVAIGIDFRF
jgi:long-chain fatty acid transport protein